MTFLPTRTRRSTTVEYMRLDGPQDVRRAERWLQQHGVESVVYARTLVVIGAGGTRMPANVGQVLIRDVDLGDFTVESQQRFEALYPDEESA